MVLYTTFLVWVIVVLVAWRLWDFYIAWQKNILFKEIDEVAFKVCIERNKLDAEGIETSDKMELLTQHMSDKMAEYYRRFGPKF